MSTYQHYDFITVDRPLSQAAQGALRQMSTRATITSSSFTNTYHWGDLKADPQRLVEKYFDAFLYTTDWGTRQLMFRFPQHLIDLDTAREYCYSESANAWTKGSHTLINLTYSADNYDDPDYEDFDDGEGRLGSIVPARSEVLDGDRRLLYLAWLLSADSGMLEDDELEPPVPAGLGQMSGPLQAVAEFLKIDAHLLTAAAESSPDLLPPTAQDNTALKTWITALPEKEKNRLLVSAAQDRIPNIGAELRMHFRQAQQPPSPSPDEAADEARTAGALLMRAAQLRQPTG